MWMLIGLYECVGVWNVDAYWTAQCICGICSGQMCCMLQGQKDLKWFFYLMWPVISDTKSLPFLPSLSRTHTQAQKLESVKIRYKEKQAPRYCFVCSTDYGLHSDQSCSHTGTETFRRVPVGLIYRLVLHTVWQHGQTIIGLAFNLAHHIQTSTTFRLLWIQLGNTFSLVTQSDCYMFNW